MARLRNPGVRFQLDPRSTVPAYLQIFKQVQRLAGQGKLRPGVQLPTVRQLASQLGVNFNTVARAYRLLRKAGVVSTQQGRGTFALGGGNVRRDALTLQALTVGYLTEARRNHFTASEVLTVVARQLHLPVPLDLVGERLG